MKLSQRLQAVAGLVSKGTRLADVGTDHGYIPIDLIQRGTITSAIAMDVNPGPLARAEEHIEEQHLAGYIETRRSDGLAALQASEVDSIVIAGMGGGLIIRILNEGMNKAEAVKELILQPQSDIEQVRRFLYEHGFEIVAEDAVCEDGKYYFPMRAVKEDMQSPMSELDYRYGRILLERRHPVLLDFLKKEQRVYTQITCSLKGQEQTSQIIERKTEVQEKLRLIEAALEEMTVS